MRTFIRTTFALAVFLGTCSSLAHAISGNEQVELAGAGRYEDLRIALEQDAAKGPLKTRDLHALCFAYSKTKRYNKLFQCLDQMAANLAKGDLRTRLFGLDDATPVLHLMRAEAQLELGNYAAAAEDAKKALAWYEAEGGDDADIELNGLSLLSMAATLGGNRAEGEKYAKRLEEVSTFTLRGNGYVSVKAMALARSHMALGNFQKTLDAIASDRLFSVHSFLDKLVSGALITGRNNWAWQELPRAFMMNRALQGVGKTAEAKAGYDQLLTVPQVKDNGEIYWVLLFERGVIAESEGQGDEAIGYFKKAVEVIEQQRASINTESSKIGFVGDKQKVYERLVDALYAKQRMAEAFEYIERSKSRALVDMLASKQVGALQKSDAAAGAVREFEEAESELLAQVPVSAQEGKQGQRSASAQAVAKIRSAAPELGALIAVSSMPVNELRDAIPANEALVQYYYQGQKLYASIFTRTDIRMVRLESTALEEDIKKFRALVDNLDPQAIAMSKKLYDTLVRPLESGIGNSQRLLVIPHGPLHYMPFSALHDGQKYLFERYALRSLPSASVLKYLRNGPAGRARQTLVLGNPDLGDPKLDLPSAQVEAEKIAGAGQARLLLRQQATETALKNDASGFSSLHIASHGIFNAKKPLDSHLLLAKDGANDGKLTVSELYSLRLNADLVTLSACETGLGQVNTGDDVVGLTRGFLYAGTSNVVASLWQVDDEATSQLMIHFYAQLASKPKVEALRAAQLEVMKKYPHPFFWSAFYLTGSGV